MPNSTPLPPLPLLPPYFHDEDSRRRRVTLGIFSEYVARRPTAPLTG